jgi:hypothetical protein
MQVGSRESSSGDVHAAFMQVMESSTGLTPERVATFIMLLALHNTALLNIEVCGAHISL